MNIEEDKTERNLKIKIGIFTYDLDTPGGSGKSLRELRDWLMEIGEGLIEIIVVNNPSILYKEENLCDIILTQQYAMKEIQKIKEKLNIPVIAFIRGKKQIDFAIGADLVVYNSHWLLKEEMDKINEMGIKAIVFHPIVNINKSKNPLFKTSKKPIKKYISFISRDDPYKNPDLFINLAKKRQDLDFLFVGASQERIIKFREDKKKIKNLKMVPYSTDVLDYYRESKVLVFPSLNESFGRVALEAAFYNIPTITTNLPGILEATDNKSLYLSNPQTLGDLNVKLNLCLKNYGKYEAQCNKICKKYQSNIQQQSGIFLMNLFQLIHANSKE